MARLAFQGLTKKRFGPHAAFHLDAALPSTSLLWDCSLRASTPVVHKHHFGPHVAFHLDAALPSISLLRIAVVALLRPWHTRGRPDSTRGTDDGLAV